ncbi:ABC transporter substrate-binding protein [Consotaella aegiceratis]|uniref:ABC transporter substrate-binding protein n=1 Tax=Consotaella aegiceratis TaxID=3097961 RepID=UPI002F3FCFB0
MRNLKSMVRLTRRLTLLSFLACTAATVSSQFVAAQSREETVRYVTGGAINTLDPMMLGATPQSVQLSTGVYDRLIAFDRKPRDDGSYVFVFDKLHGELAKSFDVSEDGLTITFHLRPNATWQDGSPVTADDVKWSLDRAVTADTMSKAQLKTGSLVSPDQFKVIDEHTVEVTLDKADRLALPNLASLYAPMYNSKLVKAEAGPDDPWGVEWLQSHTAASGAFIVDRYAPGQQVVLKRNDNWKGGDLPAFRQAIVQTVPEASTRANLIERGDADITTDLLPEDMVALRKADGVQVLSEPMPTAFVAVIFNTQMAPFDNEKVRQAVSLALPYDAMFQTAVSGLGGKLYGASWTDEPQNSGYPQPLPLHTDVDAAKKKLAEAGYPDGFETTLSYSVSRATFADPAAALVQEALAKIGITVKINKMPDPQMAEAETNKTIPMLIERSYAMFPSAEYFARIFMSGDSRWNFSSWNNEEVNEMLPKARYEADQAKYDAIAKKVIGLAAEEVPMAMLWQPTQDVVMSKDLTGFTTWYHYYVDLRDLEPK